MIPDKGQNVFKLSILPRGWKACLLNEAVNINGGSQPPKTVFKSELEEGYIRLVQIRDYKSDRFLTYVPKDSTKKFCNAEDIMIGRYGPPVFQILRGIPGAYNVALMKAEPLDNMNRDYLFYLLSSPPVQKLVIGNSQRTAGQTGVNLRLLNSCIIPLPPLPQQKKIAAILDAADAYRQKTKALIAKYDELTQSLFLDMFGDPVRNERGWEKKQLKDFGNIVTGNTPSRKNHENYNNEFIEWIKTNNINSDFTHVTSAKEYLSEEGLKNGRSVKKGSLLVACIAGSIKSIGRAALTDRKVAFNQQINAIEPSDEINSNFLYHLFKSSSEYIQNHASHGMKRMLSKGDFQQIRMIHPSIHLQNQFAERVQAIEIQKVQANASLANAEDLFNSLLQKAFKGELS